MLPLQEAATKLGDFGESSSRRVRLTTCFALKINAGSALAAAAQSNHAEGDTCMS